MTIARAQILSGLSACDARVYRFVAGAGFGKSTLAWELAGRAGGISLCDMLDARNAIDVSRRLLTAIAKLAGPDGEAIAKESLTLTLAQPAERDAYLTAVGQHTDLHGTLLVENAEHLLDEARISPLRAFLSGRPPCTVIVCSRTDLDLQLARSYAPHEFMSVRERDLRFDISDFRRILGTRVDDGSLERAFAWSAGWPLAATRAIELLRRGDELPALPASQTWLRELVTQTVNSISAVYREPLFALAAIADFTPETDVRRHLLAAVPFLTERPDASLELHALAREALLEAFPEECRRAIEAAFAQASARGDHVRCAELALRQDDAQAAADALVLADHDFHQMPPARYVAILERLDRDIVLARPALWMVSEVCLKSDFLALNHELEPVFRAQATSLPPRARMACAALVCFRRGEYDGRWEEGRELLDEFERTLSHDCVRPKDLLYAAHYQCGAASNEGLEFDGAAHVRTYGDELASAPILYGEYLFWDVTRAYFRGDAAGALAAADRYVNHVRDCGYPIYRRASLYRSLFTCWELDAREQFERYRRELISLLTQPSTPHDLIARLAWEMLDATSGVPPYHGGPIVSTECLTNIMLAAQADEYDLADAAMNQALELSGNPALRAMNIKLSVAAFSFDPAANEHLLERAFVTFSQPAAPALRACVKRLQAGEDGGILEPLAARFRAAGERHRGALFIDVTLARVRRGGIAVALSDREFDLLMLLAASGRALPAIEVAEMLWPASDDAAARNALKVCISRIRARAGSKGAIVMSGGDVSLSAAHTQTDLDRAERLLRLAAEGSAAALSTARAILERPIPEQYLSSPLADAFTRRWESLRTQSAALHL